MTVTARKTPIKKKRLLKKGKQRKRVNRDLYASIDRKKTAPPEKQRCHRLGKGNGRRMKKKKVLRKRSIKPKKKKKVKGIARGQSG